MLSLKINELSKDYLSSALYNSIDQEEETISVPNTVYYSKEIKEDYTLIITTMMYWGFDNIPDILAEYVFNNILIDLPDVPNFKESEYYENLVIIKNHDVLLAASKGLFYAMKFLIDKGIKNYKITGNAAMNGHLDCLKYAHENGCPWSENTCYSAARYGHLDCLKYAHKNGCSWTKETCIAATENNHVDCLKYAFENGIHSSFNYFQDLSNILSDIAARKGSLECLIYIHEKTESIKWSICSLASMNGHLHILKYLKSFNLPWYNDPCSCAAMNGHLDCLKYLHENLCPWTNQTCTSAAMNGHLECLKYLHEQGCSWYIETCRLAAWNGHLECLKYAHENGCPWDISIYNCAIDQDNYDCADYYYKETYPWLHRFLHLFG